MSSSGHTGCIYEYSLRQYTFKTISEAIRGCIHSTQASFFGVARWIQVSTISYHMSGHCINLERRWKLSVSSHPIIFKWFWSTYNSCRNPLLAFLLICSSLPRLLITVWTRLSHSSHLSISSLSTHPP